MSVCYGCISTFFQNSSFDPVHLTHTLRPVLGVRVWTRGEVVGEEGEGVMVNRGEEQEMVKERLEDVRLTSVT